jgi:hypothetical protein
MAYFSCRLLVNNSISLRNNSFIDYCQLTIHFGYLHLMAKYPTQFRPNSPKVSYLETANRTGTPLFGEPVSIKESLN